MSAVRMAPAVVGKPYNAEPTTVFTLVMFT